MTSLRQTALLAALAGGLLVLHGSAHADGFQAHQLTDADGRIELDGVLNDAAWLASVPYDRFYQTQPTDKVLAKQRSEVRVAYDKKYLYLGIMAYDDHPEAIQAPFARRDKTSEDQDLLGVYIDTSGNGKSAQFIHVNARGAISDGVYTDANAEDLSPDFDFDTATARVPGGWSTEIRIPFTSLPYRSGQQVPWRLLVYRNMTRDQRYRMYSGEMTLESNCLLCFSAPIDGLRQLPSGLNWTATPYLVAGRGHEDVAGQPRRNFKNHDVGLDVKIRPDSASVIDATINPDFSQVELDDPILSGNASFSQFVPEKRPFFLEGADILQTPFRVINTRTITDPSWGGRYTRRDENSDLTVLTTRDAGGGLVQLPGPYSTNYASQDFASIATIARVNTHRENMSVGMVLTDRTLENGRGYNRAAGADFSWQRTDSERLRGQVLVSSTSAQADAEGVLQKAPARAGHAAKLEWTKDTDEWGFIAATEEVSEGFRADNGFMPQAGYQEYGASVAKKWGVQGIWNEVKSYVYADRKIDRHGNVIADDFYPALWVNGPYNTQLELRLKPNNHLRIAADGELFSLRQLTAIASTAPGRGLGLLYAELELGDEVELASARLGKGGKLTTVAHFRPANWFEIEPTYSVNWVNSRDSGSEGRRLYAEYALQVNSIVHLGPSDTVRVTLQRSSSRRNQALYDFPVQPLSHSNVASVVYNHVVGFGSTLYAGFTFQKGETPGYSPLRRQNEVFLKLSWRL